MKRDYAESSHSNFPVMTVLFLSAKVPLTFGAELSAPADMTTEIPSSPVSSPP